jgi:predicted ribonuclease YlaK
VRASVQALRDARGLLPDDPIHVRVAVDTNALIDCPDLTVYTEQLGTRYRVHVLPVVLRELDNLKRAGRVPELREAARVANRRLKGLRDNGDVRAGVRVSGDISAVFEHVEPRSEGLPGWLDLTVPDDRLVASALLLQSAHPGSAVFVATSDLNLQTKLAAVSLPFIEPPD